MARKLNLLQLLPVPLSLLSSLLAELIFIFVGGPLVEITHGKLAFTMRLKAITAAMGSVIFNLALLFAYHVFWLGGWGGSIDLFSLGLACNSDYCCIPVKYWHDPDDYLIRILGMMLRLFA